jgi:hypothetical protein
MGVLLPVGTAVGLPMIASRGQQSAKLCKRQQASASCLAALEV